jgi:hypothetical protein
MAAPANDPQENAGTISAEQLCSYTGLTDRRHRQLAAAGYFPPPIMGRYQAGKTLLGIIRYQRELIQKKSNKLAREQQALTKAKREMAQEELAEFRRKYVPKEEIGPHLRNLSLNQRAALQRKLEQELAPKLAGLTTLEIIEKVKAAVDEVCQIFREGTRGWMEVPPNLEPSPKKASAAEACTAGIGEAAGASAIPGDSRDHPQIQRAAPAELVDGGEEDRTLLLGHPVQP